MDSDADSYECASINSRRINKQIYQFAAQQKSKIKNIMWILPQNMVISLI